MAMAMALRRGAERAGTVMRAGEWSCGGGARFMATAVRVEDDGSPSSSFSSGRALAAFSAVVGAGALYSSCLQTIRSEPAAAEAARDMPQECAPRTALNPNEFVKFKLAEVRDINHNTKVYRYAFRNILVDEILDKHLVYPESGVPDLMTPFHFSMCGVNTVMSRTCIEAFVSHASETVGVYVYSRLHWPFPLFILKFLWWSRFAFNPQEALGLHVASCLVTKAEMGKKKDGTPNYIIRPYTPISPPDSKGYFDLMIKIYPKGNMTQHLAHLKPGDTLEVKGPIPKLAYEPNMKKQIGMVAGGTGLTPMLQVIDAIVSNPEDNTQVSLVYANTTPADILLKSKLDSLAFAHPNFKVFYVVSKESEGWKGGKGHVTKDVLKKGLPSPSDDTLILVCGPPGLMNLISGDKAPDKSQGELIGMLKDLGYTPQQVYKF
ncbi:hypothetical protein KC19_1G136000 [Ceratodon purpureus]|uniref:cytochrome-b5 reductase n=1 Tax=Ceratodon purpureus TaxID=3225 RepID=A0A8T0J7U6_CERPU|nr:hypothetical protein KC19_1G136000 [Ceratodon purpureus]